jgi:hypothetical protein
MQYNTLALVKQCQLKMKWAKTKASKMVVVISEATAGPFHKPSDIQTTRNLSFWRI